MDMMKEIKQEGFSSKVFLVALHLYWLFALQCFITHSAEARLKIKNRYYETTAVYYLDDSGDENLYRSYFENGYDLVSILII